MKHDYDKEKDIMKGNLKNIFGLVALGTMLLVTTVSSWAGAVRTEKVSIEKLGSQFVHAWGTLVGALQYG